MKKIVLALAAAGALSGVVAQPAAACEPTKPTNCEAVDVVVDTAKHATWQLLGDIWP